jgi:DNA-binding MarR family transcriptional regulator
LASSNRKPSRKRELFDELIYEVRRSQAATDRYDEAVADAIGINRTDLRCLDVIQRDGPVSAGRLAADTGLTTGAITSVLDRLERAGFARRVPDPSDRRRVLVEMRPEAMQGGFYEEHAAHGERAFRRYTEAELELLLGFVREGRELNEREAAKLEARTRESRRGGSSGS